MVYQKPLAPLEDGERYQVHQLGRLGLAILHLGGLGVKHIPGSMPLQYGPREPNSA